MSAYSLRLPTLSFPDIEKVSGVRRRPPAPVSDHFQSLPPNRWSESENEKIDVRDASCPTVRRARSCWRDFGIVIISRDTTIFGADRSRDYEIKEVSRRLT